MSKCIGTSFKVKRRNYTNPGFDFHKIKEQHIANLQKQLTNMKTINALNGKSYFSATEHSNFDYSRVRAFL